MKDKVVLITGANGGLGSHVTKAFLEAGAKVAGVSPKIQQSDFSSPTFTALPGDISTASGSKNLVESVLTRFGKLDVVVHTVGGFAGGQSIADTDDATFNGMFNINLYATFYLVRAALPAMRKAGGGRIIAIGSRAAVEPDAGVGAYSASKAAMVSLVKTVALENKDVGITANVILPGTIDTAANRKAMPKADVSKWVQPANIARLIVWLAGDAGKDVNGAAIPVYGSDV
jgi:NAD(P)-dependent dehydrogenase (short-subunit alcohol dehydrogenase family)